MRNIETLATMTTENGRNVVRANADIFIIPNSASKFDLSFSIGEKRAAYTKHMCEMNGKNFDVNNDKIIQTWIVSDDSIEGINLGSENVTDHGFRFTDETNIYYAFGNGSKLYGFPKTLLPEKENETVTIIIPDLTAEARYNKSSEEKILDFEDKEITFDLHLTVKANQKNYRYRNFGTFEETLVCVGA